MLSHCDSAQAQGRLGSRESRARCRVYPRYLEEAFALSSNAHSAITLEHCVAADTSRISLKPNRILCTFKTFNRIKSL